MGMTWYVDMRTVFKNILSKNRQISHTQYVYNRLNKRRNSTTIQDQKPPLHFHEPLRFALRSSFPADSVGDNSFILQSSIVRVHKILECQRTGRLNEGGHRIILLVLEAVGIVNFCRSTIEGQTYSRKGDKMSWCCFWGKRISFRPSRLLVTSQLFNRHYIWFVGVIVIKTFPLYLIV